MKLSLKLVLLFSLGVLIPGLSVAELSPYVGADVVLRDISLKGVNSSAFPKSGRGANVYGGLQVLPNVAVELGANTARHHKKGTSTKLKGLHTSLVGNYAVKENVSAIGSLGLSHLKYRHKNDKSNLKYNKVRPRLGLGVQYNINPSVSWRTMGLWEGRFGKKPVNYTPTQGLGVSTGLGYKF
jgi:hypothetical protein